MITKKNQNFTFYINFGKIYEILWQIMPNSCLQIEGFKSLHFFWAFAEKLNVISKCIDFKNLGLF